MRFRLAGQYVQGSIIALVAIELCALALAFYLSVHFRFRNDPGFLENKVGVLELRMLAFAIAILLGLMAFGLYSPRQRARAFGILVRLIASICLGTAIAAVIFYFAPNVWVGRGVLALAALLSLFMLIATRVLFSRVVDERIFKRRVLVYGAGNRALPISRLRRRTDRRGFIIVGFVPVPGEASLVDAGRCLSAGGSLAELSQKYEIDEIVVAVDDRRRHFPCDELIDCRFAGVSISEPLTFLERETGRIVVDELTPGWMIFGEGFRRTSWRIWSARVLDIVASVGIIVLTLPLIVAAVLAIKIEDGWNAKVIYRQMRVGHRGKLFALLKFRSMRVDAEADGRARWAQSKDPRATRVGAIIRRLRIDELPQIVNVLYGDMSFVGPRPERPQFVAELAKKIPYYSQRHCVKPGITGWAQLCYPYGASDTDARRKLDYDLYYIKNSNLLFDLAIMLQTAEVVLLGQGTADRVRRLTPAGDVQAHVKER
jgi:sugar transferase (PEP-CTERM system associated)